ncbi:MAG: patatin-like phospholipase family protein [Holdemania massiliensis]
MKTAWVLCGGGSRGAYEIGVWQTFRAAGMMPDIVTGTSIGALNGALIVQQDYEAALDLWENLRIDDVMKDGIDLELSAIMETNRKSRHF